MELRWRTSSYSGGSGQCVEVACGQHDEVLIRDSKNPMGGELRATREQLRRLAWLRWER
jgi:hypothetical protein